MDFHCICFSAVLQVLAQEMDNIPEVFTVAKRDGTTPNPTQHSPDPTWKDCTSRFLCSHAESDKLFSQRESSLCDRDAS